MQAVGKPIFCLLLACGDWLHLEWIGPVKMDRAGKDIEHGNSEPRDRYNGVGSYGLHLYPKLGIGWL